MSGAIDRWENEGQIDSARAASLRHLLSTSEAEMLLKHMGAHMVLSVAIAIPIPGLRSTARFLWTLGFRLKARYALTRGRITREEYDVARSIHSVPVILLALVPALGAMAYAASDTMVKRGLGRMLLDQSAHKVPFGLYQRLGLGRIIAPRSQQPAIVEEAQIVVKGGYTPAVLVVKAGHRVRLNFKRQETVSCSEMVLLPDFDRSATLPPGEIVPIELTPETPGEYEFQCQMGMLRGKLVVV